MTGLDAYCREVLETKGPLKYYRVRFSLDKLTPGVDNVRYDVNISASFREKTTRLVNQLMTAEVKALGGFLTDTKISRLDVEWGEFRQGFSEVLLEWKQQKPVIACLMAPPGIWDEEVRRLEEGGALINLPTPERAARAMAALWKYNTLKNRSIGVLE